MDPNVSIEIFQSAAGVTAAAQLIRLDLSKKFPAIFWYATFVAILNLALGAMERSSIPYFWTYVLIAPLENIFSIFVVRELITVMFGRYPGIRTVGRWAMYAGIGISITLSILVTKYFWYAGAIGRKKWGLFYIEITQRAIMFSLVVAIVAMLFALSRYPLHLSRNTYLSCGFFSALFLMTAARLFIDAAAQSLYTNVFDWTVSACLALCLGSWAFLLRPETATATQIAFSTPREERLLQQLEALNQLLSRAARR